MGMSTGAMSPLVAVIIRTRGRLPFPREAFDPVMAQRSVPSKLPWSTKLPRTDRRLACRAMG
jgi:hypothetical protein